MIKLRWQLFPEPCAELAGKLLENDPARAKAEIEDLEKISRETLAEVRHTIRGYRVQSIEAEVKHAKSTLETAGLTVECRFSKVAIMPAQEVVLALVLREAATNIVRHAQARNCYLQLQQIGAVCQLEIRDDGLGSLTTEGYGLRGMRERVEAFGGTLLQDAQAGTKLIVTLPLAQSGRDHQ